MSYLKINKRRVKLSENIFYLVKKIPRGKITTYQELARACGNKKLARAVGNVLGKNIKLITIPCHRVIKSNGQVGGYAKGITAKKKLLKKEGLEIKNNQVVDFKKRLFKFS